MNQTEPPRSTSALSAASTLAALPDGELLSALADGELGGSNVAAACSAYAAGESQACWHAYHLIGDVLRSEDLASPPGHDSAFIAALRVRLAVEPVVLAPSSTVATPVPRNSVSDARRSRVLERTGTTGRLARWGIVPSAMAAGFALVAAGILATRMLAPTTANETLQAQATVPAARADLQRVAAVPAAVTAATTEPTVMFADSSVVRDARLDRYLAAHQQFAGTSALTVPSGFLRNVTVDTPH